MEKKYEEKIVKGCKNKRSNNKCMWHNCVVKKTGLRTIDGEIIETIYTHNHCKPKPSKKRNSLSQYLYFTIGLLCNIIFSYVGCSSLTPCIMAINIEPNSGKV